MKYTAKDIVEGVIIVGAKKEHRTRLVTINADDVTGCNGRQQSMGGLLDALNNGSWKLEKPTIFKIFN